MRGLFAAVIVAIFLPSPLRAQGFWITKEYKQWSTKECAKLLSDSPWAKSRTIVTMVPQPLGEPSTVPDADASPMVTYLAQLWYALPLRQASVRRAQLSPAFGRLSAQQRHDMESRQASLLAEQFPDSIVVRIEYSTTIPGYRRDLEQYWHTRSADLYKQEIYLYSSHGKHTPVEFRVAMGAGGVFESVFLREENGQPVVRPADKSLVVEFPVPALGRLPGERVRLEFRLKDMMVNGQPVF